MADGTVAEKVAPGSAVNLSDSERKASLVIAGILALLGVRRLHLSGVLLLAAAGSLAFRGTTGYCAVYDALDKDTSKAG